MKRKISAKILVLAGALFAADGSRHAGGIGYYRAVKCRCR